MLANEDDIRNVDSEKGRRLGRAHSSQRAYYRSIEGNKMSTTQMCQLAMSILCSRFINRPPSK